MMRTNSFYFRYVHIKNIHGEKGSRTSKPSYECGQCGHVAKHRRLLEQHIRSVHEITVKEFQCGLCDFKAATKMSVDRHMQSHTKVCTKFQSKNYFLKFFSPPTRFFFLLCWFGFFEEKKNKKDEISFFQKVTLEKKNI